MVRKSTSSDEYELMPVKPLRDLQKEVKQLRKVLQKEDKMHEVMIKILNSNVQTQRQVMQTMHKLEEVKNSLNKFNRLITEINEDVEDEPKHLDEINNKFKGLETNQKTIEKVLNKVLGIINRKEYFKLNIPRNVPIMYRRTK